MGSAPLVEFAEVGVHDASAQGVDALTLVELCMDAAPLVDVVKLTEHRNCLGDTAIFLDGSRQLVLARGGLQPGHK